MRQQYDNSEAYEIQIKTLLYNHAILEAVSYVTNI